MEYYTVTNKLNSTLSSSNSLLVRSSIKFSLLASSSPRDIFHIKEKKKETRQKHRGTPRPFPPFVSLLYGQGHKKRVKKIIARAFVHSERQFKVSGYVSTWKPSRNRWQRKSGLRGGTPTTRFRQCREANCPSTIPCVPSMP